jgi:chromosome segregation ATPase
MHSPFAYEAFDSISHQLEDGRRNAAVLAERVSHIEKLVQALGEPSHYVQQADAIKGIDHLLQLLQEKGAKVAQAVETTQEHVNTLKQDVTNNLQRIQALVEQIQSLADTLQRIETKLNHKPTWRERIRGYFGW